MEHSKSKSLKILLIEDDLHLCRGWVEVLELLGHEVEYSQRAEAVLQNRERLNHADLVISDYYLPDLNGVELIQKIRDLRPEIPVILLTGSREQMIQEAVTALNQCLLLHKPIGIDDLEQGIWKLCAA